ncbi:MAG: hypothetical protein A2066_10055 [Bacteroidetes bacterium GWB2_41_8]|nr:MAG: hypothetical protein A2066_10055 [Bacteroidetes bacterium GWB2_41_8]
MMADIPVLAMVKREMQRRRITVSELSRVLKINTSSVSGMLKSPSFQVQRLVELSEIMNYNFFREIAAHLPYTDPVYVSESKQSEVDELKSRLKELEMENNILRKTLKDLVSR